MEELAFFSGVAQVALSAFSYQTMPGGLSYGSTNLHTVLMTVGHFATARAAVAFRQGNGKNTHALLHFLAAIAYVVAYFSLKEATGNHLSGTMGTLMTVIQGTYLAQLAASFLIVNFAPRSIVSQFIPLHRLGGIAVWLLTTAQVLYTHVKFGAKGGNLGCILSSPCNSLTEFFYHGVLFTVGLTGFATFYAIASKKRRVTKKEE